MGHVTGLVIPKEDKVEGTFYVHLPEEEVLPTNVEALTDYHLDQLIDVGGMDGTIQCFDSSPDMKGIDLSSPLVVEVVPGSDAATFALEFGSPPRRRFRQSFILGEVVVEWFGRDK